MAFSYGEPSSSRYVGLGLVILLHIVVIYALVTGLARTAIDVIRAPIETKIIQQQEQPKVEPPPPPPNFATPPPPFVPPPEVDIQTPLPVQSTAPSVVTTVQPTTPAPTAPVTIQPRVDLQHSRQPDYPPESRRLGEQGSLVLQVFVEPDGHIADARIAQSSGFPRLDQAAVDGIKTSYRFVPGTIDGKPQAMWYTFKFTWKLQ